jgi:hypothetical protein
LPDWDNIALNGRDVRIVFDSDYKDNSHVRKALTRLYDLLGNKKAAVKVAYLPAIDDRSKTGVDDWLAAGHSLQELEGLLRNMEQTDRTPNRILSGEYIEQLAKIGYEFKMLELDYTIEVNGEPLNDAIEAEIRTRLRDTGFDKVNVARDAYIAHAYQHRYHPIKDYLEAQTWDGQDHISALAKHFADKDQVFYPWLRKWLIGAVARVYQEGTFNRVLILAGEQDLGKSYFVRWLTSGVGSKFYTDSGIDPENKDHLLRLMNTWVWEVGELNATTSKADRNALKSFLSREQVRERVPYGRNDIIRPALTSFIATANPDSGFLNDPTGNRRFASCELTFIAWEYATKINVNQVWAQAKHLFDSGEEWRYSGDEKDQVNTINARYEIENPVYSWLEEITETATDDIFTPTTKIIEQLRNRGVRGSDKALAGDIASFMRRLGVERFTGRDDGKLARGWRGVQLKLDTSVNLNQLANF